MKLDDVLTHTGKFCAAALVVGAIGASVGYDYANFAGTNALLTVQAATIAAIATFIFRQCVEIGFEDSTPTLRNLVHMIGYTTGGISASYLFKKLEILTPRGGTFFNYAVIAINLTAFIGWMCKDYFFTND